MKNAQADALKSMERSKKFNQDAFDKIETILDEKFAFMFDDAAHIKNIEKKLGNLERNFTSLGKGTTKLTTDFEQFASSIDTAKVTRDLSMVSNLAKSISNIDADLSSLRKLVKSKSDDSLVQMIRLEIDDMRERIENQSVAVTKIAEKNKILLDEQKNEIIGTQLVSVKEVGNVFTRHQKELEERLTKAGAFDVKSLRQSLSYIDENFKIIRTELAKKLDAAEAIKKILDLDSKLLKEVANREKRNKQEIEVIQKSLGLKLDAVEAKKTFVEVDTKLFNEVAAINNELKEKTTIKHVEALQASFQLQMQDQQKSLIASTAENTKSVAAIISQTVHDMETNLKNDLKMVQNALEVKTKDVLAKINKIGSNQAINIASFNTSLGMKYSELLQLHLNDASMIKTLDSKVATIEEAEERIVKELGALESITKTLNDHAMKDAEVDNKLLELREKHVDTIKSVDESHEMMKLTSATTKNYIESIKKSIDDAIDYKLQMHDASFEQKLAEKADSTDLEGKIDALAQRYDSKAEISTLRKIEIDFTQQLQLLKSAISMKIDVDDAKVSISKSVDSVTDQLALVKEVFLRDSKDLRTLEERIDTIDETLLKKVDALDMTGAIASSVEPLTTKLKEAKPSLPVLPSLSTNEVENIVSKSIESYNNGRGRKLEVKISSINIDVAALKRNNKNVEEQINVLKRAIEENEAGASEQILSVSVNVDKKYSELLQLHLNDASMIKTLDSKVATIEEAEERIVKELGALESITKTLNDHAMKDAEVDNKLLELREKHVDTIKSVDESHEMMKLTSATTKNYIESIKKSIDDAIDYKLQMHDASFEQKLAEKAESADLEKVKDASLVFQKKLQLDLKEHMLDVENKFFDTEKSVHSCTSKIDESLKSSSADVTSVKEWVVEELDSIRKTGINNKFSAFEAQMERNIEDRCSSSMAYFTRNINESLAQIKSDITLYVKGKDGRHESGIEHANTAIISVKEVEQIVGDSLEIYNADRVGRVDYAIEVGGGSIVHSLTSRTMYVSLTKMLSASIGPELAIRANMHIGHCWPFEGQRGSVAVRLYPHNLVIPDSVSIEHVPRSIAHNLGSAPQKFEIWSYKDENDRNPQRLTSGVYDVVHGRSVQVFRFANDKVVPIAQLRILSNSGHEKHTCLYRIRVHGKTVTGV